MSWTAPPEPITWRLEVPVAEGSTTFDAVTLRAPTAGDILKASAIPGASGMDVTLRLIAAVSAEGIPYDLVKMLPLWMVEQMGSYMDEFGGAPAPDPLEAWRAARRADRVAAAS